jgi:hypothetical protein
VTLAECFDEYFVSAFEFTAVVFEAWQELRATFSCDGLVFGGECLGVLLETFDTEKLRLKRLLIRITAGFAY